MTNKKIIAFIIGLMYFIAGLVTLPHYGINWDTINHLPRGQVYLHYFLTGNKDYNDLPQYFKEWQEKGQWYWQKGNTLFYNPDIPKNEVPRLSLYQRAGVDFNYFMQKDGGHPPLSDIISSFFNYVLFQKTGIVNDVDAYRVYGVLLAAALVGLIYYWVSTVYGGFAGLISALSLSLYPFFWSESHFNTEKDIPETSYWSFFLFTIWQGVRKKSWKWVLSSGIFFGLALGSKFNILFVGFIIIPWLFITSRKVIFKKWFLLSSFGALFTGLTIFIASWPFLWADPITRLQKVFGFYKGIGLTDSAGTGTYALSWILYATPIVILILSTVGLVKALKLFHREKYSLALLSVLWFIIPIVRVTWPGTVIYGGIRQIMEFMPAMSILAGLGGKTLLEMFPKNKKLLIKTLMFMLFLPVLFKIIQIHPNENVYFNQLIGGLSGAKEKNFPFWGNTFGAAYRQGANWINENAETGANVVYAFELIPNIPRIWLRTDLNLHNSNRSGYLRRGEYAITLPFQGTEKRSYYDMYLREFLNPVYESKVDGVSVVTVWKNDNEYLKKPWDETEYKNVVVNKIDDGVRFILSDTKSLSRLDINYSEVGCNELESGYVKISEDGNNWTRLYGTFPNEWLIPVLGKQPKEGKFVEPFVGQMAKYIDLVYSPVNTCLSKMRNFKLYVFD